MNCTNGTSNVNNHSLQLIDANKANIPKTCADTSTLHTVLADFFILLGAVAVLMLIIAGVRYVFARGNAEKTTQAKNLIQYSIIGLVIAALASAIVNIVVDRAG